MPTVASVSRRSALGIAASVLVLATVPVRATSTPALTVWKDPNCGCCTGWVKHLRQHGFDVKVIETANVNDIKRTKGIPPSLASCHTAEVEGYAIEGHVPAHAMQRLLRERPKVAGLAVPGMPIGSPGMEGGTPEEYAVMGFEGDSISVFGRYKVDQPV